MLSLYFIAVIVRAQATVPLLLQIAHKLQLREAAFLTGLVSISSPDLETAHGGALQLKEVHDFSLLGFANCSLVFLKTPQTRLLYVTSQAPG